MNLALEAKTKQYQNIYIEALWDSDLSFEVNLNQVFATYKESFPWLWMGCYWVVEKELVLGAFQGPPACTKIAYGRGVCGQSWEKQKTIIVPDVHVFEGHIACCSRSNSEIVVPIFEDHQVIGVLDVDSEQFNAFNEVDQQHLEALTGLIQKKRISNA